MGRRTLITLAAGAALVAATAGTSIAIARGGADDGEGPITGPALARASSAALEHTDGGRVTDTEVGDEDSYYEVEVTLDDGTQVDVQLDRRFRVVGSEGDGAGDADDG
jgi:uncharacterized membrane protein YkoI